MCAHLALESLLCRTPPQSYVNGALARGRISVDWVRKTIYYTMGGCADVDWAACSTDVIKYIGSYKISCD